METQAITMQQFIAANRIRMTAERTDSNPHMYDSRDMDHWKCVLRMGNRRMTLVFSMGFGHHGAEPKLGEVLDCIASDASAADQDFEDWCSDYGYECDSRKGYKTWQATRQQAEKLRKFLGSDLFEQISSGEVERL